MTSIVKSFFKISLRFEFILLIYLTEQLRRSIYVEELEVSLEFLLLLLLLALRQMSMQQEVGVQKEEAVKAAITPIRHFLCDAIRAQWQPIHLKHNKKNKKHNTWPSTRSFMNSSGFCCFSLRLSACSGGLRPSAAQTVENSKIKPVLSGFLEKTVLLFEYLLMECFCTVTDAVSMVTGSIVCSPAVRLCFSAFVKVPH